jgi:glycosyltransferase involved in cell wall biosynthesis
MRVVIDATPLLVRSAGVKNYLYHWIRGLQRAAGDAIATFPPLGELGALRHDKSIVGRGRTTAGLAALAASNYMGLPVLDWFSHGANIFHASTLVRHSPRKTKLTATVYDMTSWIVPELHPAANLRADRSFLNLIRRADGLISISECSRQDAIRNAGIRPEKIVTIYPGIAPGFFDPPAEEVARVRKQYKLARPFILFLSTIEPRKNLDTLFDAYGALSSTLREEYELVIAGPVGWAAESTRARLASARYLGYVPEPDLAPLTAAASVFAYPSLYEGFGFPAAQAMAAGTPVITSAISSLPEIAGDAAVLIDPKSPGELRNALHRLLLSEEMRLDLAARGRERAKAFRWETCARQSLEFFRKVAA